MNNKPPIIIVGTGPAALMAGAGFVEKGFAVHFYDQKKAAGRKFLVAGHGGFNLSNSLKKEEFLGLYNRPEIREMVGEFDADDLVVFLRKIGIETYVGSSGKIFPEKEIKPIHVLQNWLNFLEENGAQFFYEHRFVDFDENRVVFECEKKEVEYSFDRLVLALGGASWSKTGSDGKWAELFHSKSIALNKFESSNAGFNIHFSDLVKQFQGEPWKHLNLKLGNKSRAGELVLTDYGLEGAPIFYLNGEFRLGENELFIDAKPSFSTGKIIEVLNDSVNISQGLKQLKIPRGLIAYIKEKLDKKQFLDASFLAQFLKNIPLVIESLRPIEEAISTVGGVPFDELNPDLSLKKYPKVYCCGEMLDWDAPTGGYLLQACFATGFRLAKS